MSHLLSITMITISHLLWLRVFVLLPLCTYIYSEKTLAGRKHVPSTLERIRHMKSQNSCIVMLASPLTITDEEYSDDLNFWAARRHFRSGGRARRFNSPALGASGGHLVTFVPGGDSRPAQNGDGSFASDMCFASRTESAAVSSKYQWQLAISNTNYSF